MTLSYFAYGSNMCSAWLQNRVPGAEVIERAVLRDYELRFRKRSSDDSSKCDVVPAAGRLVHGVVFQIPLDEKPKLDAAEGKGYYETPCTVSNLGGAQIAAFMYVAEGGFVDESLLPYAWYKRIVLSGAREHDLPAAYVAAINEVECHDDPDQQRATDKLRLAGLFV